MSTRTRYTVRSVWEGGLDFNKHYAHEDAAEQGFDETVKYYLNLPEGRGSGTTVQLIDNEQELDILAEQYID